MKRLPLALLLLFVSVCADAQHSSDYWKFFSGTNYVWEMEADGDSMWIAEGESAGGGITCIIGSTGEIINLNATNTDMFTNQVSKIAIANNHVKYIGANDGIYKCVGNDIHLLYPNSAVSFDQFPISEIEVDLNNNVWFTLIKNLNNDTRELIKYDGQVFSTLLSEILLANGNQSQMICGSKAIGIKMVLIDTMAKIYIIHDFQKTIAP